MYVDRFFGGWLQHECPGHVYCKHAPKHQMHVFPAAFPATHAATAPTPLFECMSIGVFMGVGVGGLKCECVYCKHQITITGKILVHIPVSHSCTFLAPPPSYTGMDEYSLGCMAGGLVGDAAGAVLEFCDGTITEADAKRAMTMPGGGVLQVGSGQVTDDGE